MQKMNLFLFITLLPIVIQTESGFDVVGLLKLHNDIRDARNMGELKMNPNMNLKAMDLASKSFDKNFNASSELYRINVYRFDQTSFLHKYPITPEMPFIEWITNEIFLNDHALIERPTKIILKEAKEIGIGFAIEGHVIVVVALYSTKNTMNY